MKEPSSHRIEDKYSYIEDIPNGQKILTIPTTKFELLSQF